MTSTSVSHTNPVSNPQILKNDSENLLLHQLESARSMVKMMLSRESYTLSPQELYFYYSLLDDVLSSAIQLEEERLKHTA